MKKRIAIIILSIIMIMGITIITHATIKGNVGDSSTYVSMEELNQVKESIEYWFDVQLGLDLLSMVASGCEVHGFIVEPKDKEGK